MAEVSTSGSSKCLILGGYLVLFHENTALCVSLKPKVKCHAKATNEAIPSITVITHPIENTFKLTPDIWEDASTFHGKYERFILAVCHVVFRHFGNPPFSSEITITGDSEFYTDGGKTGLGSSAATTVALTRALCRLYFQEDDDLVFKIASVAHSIAQGNVGSCFDISCAVWGTQEFRRPSPIFLDPEKLNDAWDNEHLDFHLPPNVKICLLKTDFKGSSTPNLVRRFLAKAKDDPETFNNLKECASRAMRALREGTLDAISYEFRTVRSVLRVITEKWEIGVVPDPVNSLADALEKLPGVLAAVIPGAGGYDAIAAITRTDTSINFESLGISVLAET